ncbi:arsenite efflux transporter metallochaperone ArsD [Pragia fontium]|uniref:Arsenic resistance operon repressor n=1 Tax=Pragia fontium TaxID=82985 RepID=A0ABQ5LDB4_9GAMM|nr:arsenite efflux transporter metallochaperone ArsD [Pragia fontium]AKJ42301.1 arsenic resistance operon repressor [Pragia fontium]GKX61620.1 arsenic resistance operon repressor [Pragia fontium]VEJ55482.1 Arsenical resistance operon trans-acting repressor ArsD [Pragia fontium]
MKKITVYDPALCCSSGVCGTDVDQSLVNFSADIDWIKQQGVTLTRFNLAQQPMAFVENELVKNFLQSSGAESLPLIFVDDALVMAGRYPTREDMSRWCGLSLAPKIKTIQSCCGGNSSCC